MEQPLYKLPEGWEWVPLGEITRVQSGTGFPKQYQGITDKEVPFLKVSDMNLPGNESRIISWNNSISVNTANEIKAKVMPAGTIIFPKIGAAIATNKKRMLSVPSAFDNNVMGLETDGSLIAEYLYWYLQGFDLSEWASSAALPSMKASTIKEHSIPLPPLNEQKHIVAKLDALFTRIEAAITHLQETLELSKALFASEANALFEQLAEEFGVVSLASVVKINSGIALPKIFKDWNSSGSIPFYKVAQMNNDARIMKDAEITFDVDVAVENRIKIFPKGSVLIPKRGGAILTDKKRLLVEGASYDSNVMGLKADEKTISDEFLYRFMLSIHLGDYIDTAVIPQINNKHIERMEIPPAPLERQKQVVTHLDALADRTRTLEAETQERLDQLATLKSSLLDTAFRGQLFTDDIEGAIGAG